MIGKRIAIDVVLSFFASTRVRFSREEARVTRLRGRSYRNSESRASTRTRQEAHRFKP